MQSFSQAFDSYDAAIEQLGLANLAHLIPFPPDEIINALNESDYSLNTLPIKIWDRAAGFITDSDGQLHRVPSGLT